MVAVIDLVTTIVVLLALVTLSCGYDMDEVTKPPLDNQPDGTIIDDEGKIHNVTYIEGGMLKFKTPFGKQPIRVEFIYTPTDANGVALCKQEDRVGPNRVVWGKWVVTDESETYVIESISGDDPNGIPNYWYHMVPNEYTDIPQGADRIVHGMCPGEVRRATIPAYLGWPSKAMDPDDPSKGWVVEPGAPQIVTYELLEHLSPEEHEAREKSRNYDAMSHEHKVYVHNRRQRLEREAEEEMQRLALKHEMDDSQEIESFQPRKGTTDGLSITFVGDGMRDSDEVAFIPEQGNCEEDAPNSDYFGFVSEKKVFSTVTVPGVYKVCYKFQRLLDPSAAKWITAPRRLTLTQGEKKWDL